MPTENISTMPKPFVFVLMPFEKAFDDIYKFGIKGAADDVKAYAERLDEQIFKEGMLDRIFNQISRADVIVADMTGRNPNVFYEVGYAHALDKIVLLLTQNAKDIPFDLKHRQHTVYGGSIDILRKELVHRLQWAIAEARRSPQGERINEMISIRILNTDIPKGVFSKDSPTILHTTIDKAFWIPIQIRNDSYEPLSPITHAYLFTISDTKVIPCRYQTIDTSKNRVFSSAGQINISRPLQSFNANPIDAPDGLTSQFHLIKVFQGLPPGATEDSFIDFIISDNVYEINTPYRLRLHTQSQYHDFSFNLQITFRSKEKEKGESY